MKGEERVCRRVVDTRSVQFAGSGLGSARFLCLEWRFVVSIWCLGYFYSQLKRRGYRRGGYYFLLSSGSEVVIDWYGVHGSGVGTGIGKREIAMHTTICIVRLRIQLGVNQSTFSSQLALL